MQGAKVNVDAIRSVKVKAAKVVIANVNATIGVIHVIDKVILPPKT